MFSRYVSSLLIGVVVTTCLFYIMSTLIATGKSAFSDDSVPKLVDFVRIKQDDVVNRRLRKVEKPEKPQAPPPAIPRPQLNRLTVRNKLEGGVSFNANISVQATTMQAGEGDYLPIVKVLPIYPRRALSRGIEGYVIVEFMVTKLGTTQDIKVVEAQPPGYFERAAIQAASKFKYKPKVINGEPMDVAGVRNKITFEMEKPEED
ncbi:MAG: TonB family protein [Gammaproteobacteria bacterium]|nr:TonB family protein [Gammaproteobacteria bacterium]